jgi:hypothetical protein
VDHGDHDHSLDLRHLVAPNWPRFQPYYHETDWLLFSDFQWLVNRRFGLLAPENPANGQLISLAGKFFGDEQVGLLRDIRESAAKMWRCGGLQNRGGVLQFLGGFGAVMETAEVYRAVERNDDAIASSTETAHGYRIKLRSKQGVEIPLKGPMCNPHFNRTAYEKKREADLKRYQEFARNPFGLWHRFLDGVRKRRESNLRHFPAYFDCNAPEVEEEFAELHPARLVREANVPQPDFDGSLE